VFLLVSYPCIACIGKDNPVFLWLTPIRKKYKKNAKRNDYLPSSSIITKLATGLKRWQPLKYPAHAKDYSIKPHQLFIAFPFALIQPLWLVTIQSLKQFRYLA
jgi:hypothetical protein